MAVSPATRRLLVRTMRACTASRLPYNIKARYISTLTGVLGAPTVPTESDYGTRFLPGTKLNSLLEYRGVHEPVLSEFIRRHVLPGDVCVDAGANVGYFSVLLAKQVGPNGKVIAVEAAPQTVERLRANVSLNNVEVTVIESAVTSSKGEVTFHLHPQHDSWNRITPPDEDDPDRAVMGGDWVPITVKADTLSAIVGADKDLVSFIKLDIEGAEPAVTPDIATFPNPGLVVALEAKSPNITATLKPFADGGFYVYDLHNDWRWLYERAVPAITQANYADFAGRSMVDVLVSRRRLDV
ncbi:MAG: FkbM family methyltransferase [Mycobacterium sp.]|nr:FkbM family methyltransferase [Mycobacterium sp.]MCB0940272.1 FkbM family methyltransferase [Mycobacterium sp.]